MPLQLPRLAIQGTCVQRWHGLMHQSCAGAHVAQTTSLLELASQVADHLLLVSSKDATESICISPLMLCLHRGELGHGRHIQVKDRLGLGKNVSCLL